MRNNTLFLPGFSHRLMGSRGRTQALHLGEESLYGLAKVILGSSRSGGLPARARGKESIPPL